MVIDEPALWQSIPEDRREDVARMARAMCEQAAREGGLKPCGCGGDRHPDDGSCIAFGLYGDDAWTAIQTTEG